MSVQFGFCVPVFASPGGNLFRTPNYDALDPRSAMDLSKLADKLGYHALWVADHLMLGDDHAIMEGWTTLSALAGCTERAKLGIIHQANLFRNPALAAKMASTIDCISDGRFVYFADPGSARTEHLAYGLSWIEDHPERTSAFAEALDIVLALWQSQEPLTRSGRHYVLSDAICRPQPVQKPHPPIWMGSTTPQMHNLCAQYAQGWNTTPVSIKGLRTRLVDLKSACDQAGRDYSKIEKSLEIQILIGNDHQQIRNTIHGMLAHTPDHQSKPDLLAYLDGTSPCPPANMQSDWLIGTPREVRNRIDAYVDEGISHFMLWFVDTPSDEGLRLFASEVLPAYS